MPMQRYKPEQIVTVLRQTGAAVGIALGRNTDAMLAGVGIGLVIALLLQESVSRWVEEGWYGSHIREVHPRHHR